MTPDEATRYITALTALLVALVPYVMGAGRGSRKRLLGRRLRPGRRRRRRRGARCHDHDGEP